MSNTIRNILIGLSVIGILYFVIKYFINQSRQKKVEVARLEAERAEKERIRLEIAEAKRLKEKIYIETLYPFITKLKNEFQKFVSLKDGYFNNNKLIAWKSSAINLYDILGKYDIDNLKLDSQIASDIREFRTNYGSGEKIRKSFNQKFIQAELKECETLLSNIEGQNLDEQQRLAVIKDEDNNLVIAGAGSGKTTIVAGKVAYVIDRFKVKPEEILLITFTRKASEEMKHRIKQKMGIDIEVNTFHSFGRKVIGEITNDMPSIIEDKMFYDEMKNIFSSLFTNDSYAHKVIKFITEYRLDSKDDNDFKSHGEYVNYIKDNNIKSYKTVPKEIGGRITMLRETCKSVDEVKIANYLFLNGINYKYEAPYQHKTSDNIYAQYKPDFYLPDYDIYIEHFGLTDRDGNVPTWFSSGSHLNAKAKYNTDIAWKRETHSKYETTLIETFSYENKEGILFDNLKKNLETKGVEFCPRTNDEIWEILDSIAKDEVTAFDTLINTFLSLFKSNNSEISKLINVINKIPDESIKTRYLLFIDIFAPILISYNKFLKSKNLIDFSDMINEATLHITNKKFKNNFKYIIIDEFQDTSIGRFSLIKALLDNNKLCRLFAVGDDWQSIYRFAGSDISLFTQFENYFGVTEHSKIETTYRFSKSMIDISSKFILSNPNQTPKELKAFSKDTLNPIEILLGNGFRNDDPMPLIEALNQIKLENLNAQKKPTILALARYNHIIELYKKRDDLFKVKYNEANKNYIIAYLEMPEFEIEFLTVHRSKGLQGDYVIILNCVSGQFGFPSEQADDPILNLLLSKADHFLNGEERRLFYVALTRSKNKTYITTNTSYKSKFIDEIDINYIEGVNSKCPVCILGNKLKLEGTSKNGKPYVRYTCSNWNMGCEYLAWE